MISTTFILTYLTTIIFCHINSDSDDLLFTSFKTVSFSIFNLFSLIKNIAVKHILSKQDSKVIKFGKHIFKQKVEVLVCY